MRLKLLPWISSISFAGEQYWHGSHPATLGRRWRNEEIKAAILCNVKSKKEESSSCEQKVIQECKDVSMFDVAAQNLGDPVQRILKAKKRIKQGLEKSLKQQTPVLDTEHDIVDLGI